MGRADVLYLTLRALQTCVHAMLNVKDCHFYTHMSFKRQVMSYVVHFYVVKLPRNLTSLAS